jgi:hypothetical protein
MENVIIMTDNQLKDLVKQAVKEVTAENEKGQIVLYTINQVSKKLGRAHKTISNLVRMGILKATPDNLISEQSINEYLKNISERHYARNNKKRK